jgi:hypothetical protein
MGSKIPETIKKHVIRQWLQDVSRDKIARDNKIGAGTVSSIVDESKQHDPEFDLLREVAAKIKRECIDVSSLASSMRLLRILEEKGLNEEQIESLIVDMDVHCFKCGLTLEKFVKMINNVSTYSDNLGIPVDHLPRYIIDGENELKKLKDELEDIKMKKHLLLQDYDSSKTLIENYKALQRELVRVKGQRDSLDEELSDALFEHGLFS